MLVKSVERLSAHSEALVQRKLLMARAMECLRTLQAPDTLLRAFEAKHGERRIFGAAADGASIRRHLEEISRAISHLEERCDGDRLLLAMRYHGDARGLVPRGIAKEVLEAAPATAAYWDRDPPITLQHLTCFLDERGLQYDRATSLRDLLAALGTSLETAARGAPVGRLSSLTAALERVPPLQL